MQSNNSETWSVYIVLCNDSSFYTGIAKDVEKRFLAHKAGKGAKYTRIRGVDKLVYTKVFDNYRKAAKRENEIKAYTRKQKELLIDKQS